MVSQFENPSQDRILSYWATPVLAKKLKPAQLHRNLPFSHIGSPKGKNGAYVSVALHSESFSNFWLTTAGRRTVSVPNRETV